jgi:hypothetical protein
MVSFTGMQHATQAEFNKVSEVNIVSRPAFFLITFINS